MVAVTEKDKYLRYSCTKFIYHISCRQLPSNYVLYILYTSSYISKLDEPRTNDNQGNLEEEKQDSIHPIMY